MSTPRVDHIGQRNVSQFANEGAGKCRKRMPRTYPPRHLENRQRENGTELICDRRCHSVHVTVNQAKSYEYKELKCKEVGCSKRLIVESYPQWLF